MAAKKTGSKPRDIPGKDARLSPKLTACVNAVLTRRFLEAQTIPALRESLAADGIQTSGSKLHEFIRRVLSVVREPQAVRLGLNRELLAIVRRRLGLPLEPRGGKSVAMKPRKRFDPRNRRRRRITLGKPPRPPAPPAARPQRAEPAIKDQPLLTGIVPEPTRAEALAFERLNRAQFAELNKAAVRKIRSVNRNVITNHWGACIDIMTRDDYGVEDLQKLFGLTYAEARSCFITIDP